MKVNRSKVVVLDLAMQMSLDMIDRLVHYTLASVLIATRELAVSMLLGMIQMDSGAQLARAGLTTGMFLIEFYN